MDWVSAILSFLVAVVELQNKYAFFAVILHNNRKKQI